jgi:hypothetical protein
MMTQVSKTEINALVNSSVSIAKIDPKAVGITAVGRYYNKV